MVMQCYCCYLWKIETAKSMKKAIVSLQHLETGIIAHQVCLHLLKIWLADTTGFIPLYN